MNNYNDNVDNNQLAERLEKIKQKLVDEESKENTVEPKLFASGRLDRKQNQYVSKSLSLSKNIEEEIKNYCRGIEAVILNYLIKKGLEVVKNSPSIINIDVKDI